MESYIRILAGTMVLVSVALTQWVHPSWFWLTVFIGLNLIQSAVTGFCPPEFVLRRLGVGGCACGGAAASKDKECAK